MCPSPRLLHGFLSPSNSVSPEPFPRSLLLYPHLHWVTHLLQAHNFQILIPGPWPLPHCPLGIPTWVSPKYHKVEVSKPALLLVVFVSTGGSIDHPVPQTPVRGATLDSCMSLVPTFDYCQFYPSGCFLHSHLCLLGPGPHPFSPGLLQPPSMGWAFLLSLVLITSTLCQDPREISLKMLLSP